MNNLPDPPVPADLDVRHFDGFILDVHKLMTSELVALSSGDEFKAAVMLWCRAWYQVPAGSLPDDDKILAAFSGAGKRWKKVKDMALRGFIKCKDGRFYNKTLTAEAMKAAKKSEKNKNKAQAAAQSRWNKNDDLKDIKPLENNKTNYATSISQAMLEPCLDDAIEENRIEYIDLSLLREIDSSNQSEKENKSVDRVPRVTNAHDDDTAEAVELWNQTAHRCGLPQILKLTGPRKSKLRARLADCAGIVGWKAALAKVESSAFLRGSSGWKASFDFLLQEKSFVNLMEGSYDNAKPGAMKPGQGPPATATDERIAASDRILKSVLQGFEKEREEAENERKGIVGMDHGGDHRGNASALPASQDFDRIDAGGIRSKGGDFHEIDMSIDHGDDAR